MKKQKKLRLHRETIQPLDLYRANGGDEWTGCLSGCTGCKGDETYTQPVLLDRAAF
jgi:hypothetical protein